MASLAAHAVSSSAGAATHAHGGKPSLKAAGGDSFADLLAAADDAAAEDQTRLSAVAPGGQPAQPVADTQNDGDSDDIADVAPDVMATLPQTPITPQGRTADSSTDKADTKAEDARPAANDNDDAQQQAPLLPLPPQPVAPQAVAPKLQAQTPSQDQTVAPPAAGSPGAAPLQAAASQAADADQGADETAQAGAAAKNAPAPAGKKSDFKTALDQVKPAAAKTVAAKPAATDGAPVRDADARSDAAGDAGKAQQQADAVPAPAADHDAIQPNSPAVAAPQQPATSAGHATSAQPAAAPAAHAAPNLPHLAVEIAARSQSGAKQFDIRLDPPELGRVDVRLSIDASGKAEAHLTADQPQTLDLLQKDAPALTRALREAGLDVSQDGLNFSLRQQQQQAGQDQPQFQSGRTLRASFATPSNETATGAAATSGRALGLLDIRV